MDKIMSMRIDNALDEIERNARILRGSLSKEVTWAETSAYSNIKKAVDSLRLMREFEKGRHNMDDCHSDH